MNMLVRRLVFVCPRMILQQALSPRYTTAQAHIPRSFGPPHMTLVKIIHTPAHLLPLLPWPRHMGILPTGIPSCHYLRLLLLLLLKGKWLSLLRRCAPPPPPANQGGRPKKRPPRRKQRHLGLKQANPRLPLRHSQHLHLWRQPPKAILKIYQQA